MAEVSKNRVELSLYYKDRVYGLGFEITEGMTVGQLEAALRFLAGQVQQTIMDAGDGSHKRRPH